MVRREIDFDEETDQILKKLAQECNSGLGEVVADLVHAHEGIEAFVEQCEEAHRASLLDQVERGKRGFHERRFTSWDEVKRRNGL